MPFGTLRKISNLSERSDHGNQHFICADDVLWWLVGFTQPLTPTSNVKQLAKPSLSMSCSRVVTMAKVIWKCTHAERRFGREWPLFCVDAVKSHQRCYVYIQLSPLLSGMVRESLKSSLRRSCCGEVRCEKEKNFCVDNFSELAQLLDFCSTRTRDVIDITISTYPKLFNIKLNIPLTWLLCRPTPIGRWLAPVLKN